MRVIARLDVKDEWVIKPIQMEGVRKVGTPGELARKYAAQGADELLYVDCVSSLYERCGLFEILKRATEDVFIPLVVCGGIRSLVDIRDAFIAGADRVAINTAAVADHSFIRRAADEYGSQAITVSIEAKRTHAGWEAYTHGGRNHTGMDAVEWAQNAQQWGAGELLVTSVDRDGTKQGLDLELIREVCGRVQIPVVASGGVGGVEDVKAAACVADGVCIAAALHSGNMTIGGAKKHLWQAGVRVRPVEAV